MLAFEDREEDEDDNEQFDSIMSSEEMQQGGAYLSTFKVDREFTEFKKKVNSDSHYKVGVHVGDYTTFFNSIKYNLKDKYVVNTEHKSILHTHAIIDMIINASKIDCIAYHSLKGYIFKINTETTYFSRSSVGGEGQGKPINTFLLKIVVLSDDNVSIKKLPPYNSVKKETESLNSFFNEARIQQEIYKATRNTSNAPICPAVMSFFYASIKSSSDILNKMDPFDQITNYFKSSFSDTEKTITYDKAIPIVDKLYNISIELIVELSIENILESDEIKFIKLPVSSKYIPFFESIFKEKQNENTKSDSFITKYQALLHSINSPNLTEKTKTFFNLKLYFILDIFKRFINLNDKFNTVDAAKAYTDLIRRIPYTYTKDNGFANYKRDFISKDVQKYIKTPQETGKIIKHLKDTTKGKRLGFIAMEYAGDYDTLSNIDMKSQKNHITNIFSNMIIMAMSTQYIHCDLHNSNIMVNTSIDGKSNPCYLIDFGRTVKMSHYEKKCFPICADNDTDTKFIDPITHGNISVDIDGTNKKTFKKMFDIKDEQTQVGKNPPRKTSMPSADYKDKVKDFIKTFIKNIALHELSYNIEHFHRNVFQTKNILVLLKDNNESNAYTESTKLNATDWLNNLINNIDSQKCYDIFNKILNFFYENNSSYNILKTRQFSSGDKNQTTTLNRLLDLTNTETSITQYLVTLEDETVATEPALAANEPSDKEFDVVLDHINQTEIEKIEIKYNDLFFTYEPGMVVVCHYNDYYGNESDNDGYKIHVVYKIYDGPKPSITLLTLTHYTYVGSQKTSLLASQEIPTKTFPLVLTNEYIYEFTEKQKFSMVPLAILIAFKETGSELQLKNEKTFTIDDFFLKDLLDVNHDEPVVISVERTGGGKGDKTKSVSDTGQPNKRALKVHDNVIRDRLEEVKEQSRETAKQKAREKKQKEAQSLDQKDSGPKIPLFITNKKTYYYYFESENTDLVPFQPLFAGLFYNNADYVEILYKKFVENLLEVVNNNPADIRSIIDQLTIENIELPIQELNNKFQGII
jgi:hypothetical protein